MRPSCFANYCGLPDRGRRLLSGSTIWRSTGTAIGRAAMARGVTC
jgi:hypothetical protein